VVQNVTINGCYLSKTGDYGIYLSGSYSHIEVSDCTILHYYQRGIHASSTSGGPKLFLKDSHLEGIGTYNNGNYGVYFDTVGTLTIERSNITKHYYDAIYTSNSVVYITDCNIYQHTNDWAVYPSRSTTTITGTTFEANSE
jgi:hypothetical protein